MRAHLAKLPVETIWCLAAVWLIATGVIVQSKEHPLDTQTTAKQSDPNHLNGEANRQDVIGKQVALPELFNFEHFMQTFGRVYANALERLARAQIYLARALQAFLSLIGFKQGARSSYEAPSRLSDRTLPELKKIMSYQGESDQLASESFEGSSGLERTPAANLDDIRSGLDQVLAQDPSGLGRLVSKELLGSKHKRNRRSLEARDRLTVDDLLSEPRVEVYRRLTEEVPGNNVYYEQPDVISYGSEEPETVEEQSHLEKEQAQTLIRTSGRQFVSEALQSARVSLASQERHRVSIEPDEIWVDHRRDNCLLETTDQGDCGSCYVFSALAYIEWLYCRTFARVVSFSKQYLLDCGRPDEGLLGCNGGTVKSVFNFVTKYGLELESHYPYRRVQEICPYEREKSQQQMGYLRFRNPITYRAFSFRRNANFSTVYPILKQKPLVAGIKVMIGHFIQYKGGVDESDCEEVKEGIVNHSMLLVGHGREDDKEYWLFRNSFEPTWGESGHYKLSKTSNCFLWVMDVSANFGHKTNSQNQGSRPQQQNHPSRSS